jgi:hypothetical protein
LALCRLNPACSGPVGKYYFRMTAYLNLKLTFASQQQAL